MTLPPSKPVELNLSKILQWLEDDGNAPSDIAAYVLVRFERWFKQERSHEWGRDAYLRFHYAKTYEQKLKDSAPSLAEIVEFIRRVGMPGRELINVNTAPAPFDRCRAGSIIAVCLAGRFGNSLVGASRGEWPRTVHGSRDVAAFRDLTAILQRSFRLQCDIQLEQVEPVGPSTHASAEAVQNAQQKFDRLRKDSRVSAIISLGACPHNAVSNEMAKAIFDDYSEDEIPVRFRWTRPEADEVDFLSDRRWRRHLCPHSDLGISFRAEKGLYYFPREPNTEVQNKVKGRRRLPPFHDAGLLAIDQRDETLLILAAGNGGNATRGCARAIGAVETIEKWMGAAGCDGRFICKPDRFAHVVAVERRKQSLGEIDDMSISEMNFETGKCRSDWEFPLLTDDPNTEFETGRLPDPSGNLGR